MYFKKKLFIFHNEKAVTHIESQPNQSSYIENLILLDINTPNNIPSNSSDLTKIYNLLYEVKQHLLNNQLVPSEQIKSDLIFDSISNILNTI